MEDFTIADLVYSRNPSIQSSQEATPAKHIYIHTYIYMYSYLSKTAIQVLDMTLGRSFPLRLRIT